VRSYDGTERQVIVADDDLTGQNFELKPEKPGNAGDAGGGQAHAVVGTGH
jgi:hypothetical protein